VKVTVKVKVKVFGEGEGEKKIIKILAFCSKLLYIARGWQSRRRNQTCLYQ